MEAAIGVGQRTTDRVRIPLRVGGGTREVVLRWEQGRWKIAHMDFQTLVPHTAAPAKAKKARPGKK